MKIEYTLHKAKHYAIQKEGESAIDAVVRSMESKPGIGRASVRLASRTLDSMDKVCSHCYQITLCGPKSKRGSWPVIGETWVNIPVE